MKLPARCPFTAALFGAMFMASTLTAQEIAADDGTRVRSELTASLAIDARWFPEKGLLATQRELYPGLVGEVRSTGELKGGRHRWVAALFGRTETGNSDRTHLEVREAAWTYDAVRWRIQGGILQRSWGVAESNPLVDIVNQRDLLETPDIHAKLGQPGLAWAVESGNAGFELLGLTLHRPRAFESSAGRFHASGVASTPTYEGEGGPRRIDLAGRGTIRSGGLDLGVTLFHGTSREPVFLRDGVPRPYYRLRTQLGIEAQMVLGAALLKVELVRRAEADTLTTAAVLGGEYTIGNVAGSGGDLVVIAEASWDERGRWTPTGLDRDLFLAMRWSPNDAASTDLTIAGMFDQVVGHQITRIEARRRWREHWKLTTELYLISRQRPSDAGYAVRRDSYVRVSAARHF